MPLVLETSACVHCNGTHTRYDAYLMTCSQCKVSYHHTCHQPPLTQDRLTSILNATFSEVPVVENTLLSWKCSRCTRAKTVAPRVSTSLGKRPMTAAYQRPAKRVPPADASVEVIAICSDSEPEDEPSVISREFTPVLPNLRARRWSSPIEIIDSPSPRSESSHTRPFADSISAVRIVDDRMDIDEEPQIAPVPDVKPDIATTWLRDIFYKDLPLEQSRRKDGPGRRPRKVRVVVKRQGAVDSFYLCTKDWKPNKR
ncbi:uncharacterized protein BT62DRAFT_935473 [Guyanagaster necrorhizus]|uniref:PHD-type domain-containing protein n=1 Tax=Guyanagaster necrorhizus TaxID=856835 RepID=A0A9P8AQS5_9AGAR|nr:uncharacterized protein BT62DRAFT_935473 [Guyanagaster necrorhizus MCA 3950]KAG7443137.1 hypothetical protein BT62DRAFT_935473 [Guyanagaster necrorhizus MCA 3950]